MSGVTDLMMAQTRQFETSGYVTSASLLGAGACRAVGRRLDRVAFEKAGTRNLLSRPWCAVLAQRLQAHPLCAALIPSDFAAVQCTLFEKSAGRNWLVPLHQDLSIAVAEKTDHGALSGWSEKEGALFVQPPPAVLESLVALRLHIDACGLDDGPLRVVPGSHRQGRLSTAAAQAARQLHGEIAIPVEAGGAMLMRPLLLHASSKSTAGRARRVLHFVFAPPQLPYGLRWR